MINLDDIGSRVLRGYYTSKDVSDLLGEILIVDIPDLQRRFDTGIATAADVARVYALVEGVYLKKYGRTPYFQQVAAQIAQGEADKLVADEARIAEEAARIEAEREATAERLDLAQRAQARRDAEVKVKADIERFAVAQGKSAEIAWDREDKGNKVYDTLKWHSNG